MSNSANPWTTAHQVSLSFTIAQSLLKLKSIESVVTSILCCPLLLLPPILPSIRVFSNELALRFRWPKSWIFSISTHCEKSEGWQFWNSHSVVSERVHAVNHVEALEDEATSWLSPENVSGQGHLHLVMICDLSILDSSSSAVLTLWEEDYINQPACKVGKWATLDIVSAPSTPQLLLESLIIIRWTKEITIQ